MKNSNKKLSIFDLKEGKVYQAFDGQRQLGKIYTVQNGKLMNASKDEDPNDLTNYVGCSWVPLKASIHFKEIKGASRPKTMSPVSVLGLKENTIYQPQSQLSGYVLRKGRQLLSVTSTGKTLDKVSLDIVQLTTMFMPVAKKTARKTQSARR